MTRFFAGTVILMLLWSGIGQAICSDSLFSEEERGRIKELMAGDRKGELERQLKWKERDLQMLYLFNGGGVTSYWPAPYTRPDTIHPADEEEVLKLEAEIEVIRNTLRALP